MTPITINNLQPQLTQRLQDRAEQNGRTVEAEITAILASVLGTEPAPKTTLLNQPDPPKTGLGTTIRQLFAEVGGVELPDISREPIREPPTF